MARAVFLDRDGTINVEKHYLHKIEDFEFLPDVLEALKLLQKAGYLLIIITNQSGIARGYYSEKDLITLNEWLINKLKRQGINISRIYYCPHLPDAKIEKYRKLCFCRKPAFGMYNQAIKDFNIDLRQSWAIGDKIRDCAICQSTNCKGFLIGKNERHDIITSVKNGQYRNIKYKINLLECAREITTSMEG